MQRLIPYAFVIIGLLLGLLAGPSQIEAIGAARSIDRFTETEALVLRLYTEEHQQGPSTEVVEFEYEVDGRTREGSNSMTRFSDERADLEALVWRDDQRLRRMKVYYDPDQPEIVSVHRKIDTRAAWAILGASALLVLFGVHGVWSYRRELRRHRAELARRERMRAERRAQRDAPD